jgi:hypothetical protein
LESDRKPIRIVSKSLYPYAKRALDIVRRKHGENMTIMLYGAEVSFGADSDGEIAIFSVSRDYFNIDAVEKALQIFVGDLQDDAIHSSPVVIIERGNGVSEKKITSSPQ